MLYSYPIEIKHIFISPGHNYFGKPKDGPGAHPTTDVDEVEAKAGRGLRGDRFYGVAAHRNAQATFFAWEVFEALVEELGLSGLSPILTRRNLVTQGVNLNQLVGQEFSIDFGDSQVDFSGASPCHPCAWMDAAIGPGAHKFLRGRGGLRARILSDGLLRKGPALLRTAVELDLTAIILPLSKPRLP
jgi:MOSC domain-containing protein YiiM